MPNKAIIIFCSLTIFLTRSINLPFCFSSVTSHPSSFLTRVFMNLYKLYPPAATAKTPTIILKTLLAATRETALIQAIIRAK